VDRDTDKPDLGKKVKNLSQGAEKSALLRSDYRGHNFVCN